MPYIDHPGIYKPANFEATIWRYMDFASLASLLRDGALFFRQVAKFSDRFEGTWPRATLDRWAANLEAIRTAHPELALRSNEEFLELVKAYRHYSYVSCWHANERESAAMWDVYGRRGDGIAIKSTIARLRDSLGPYPDPYYVGEVQYVDYEKEEVQLNSVFNALLTKRSSFEYEHEIRGLVCDWWAIHRASQEYKFPSNASDGVSVPFVLQKLIGEIRVAPQAKPWFVESVRWLLGRAGLGELLVRQSALDAEPVF